MQPLHSRKPRRCPLSFALIAGHNDEKIVIAALLAGFSLSASATQTLRFATEASYPPFEFVDLIISPGVDVDLANALCREIGAECTFTNQAFDSLIPSLKFRRFDA